MIILIYISVFTLGAILGLTIAIRSYPNREVRKVYKAFIEDEKKENGQWLHFTEVVDHSFRVIVKPNCETLYSSTFIKLTENSYELIVPEISEYFSINFLNSDTDIIGTITNQDVNSEKPTSILLTNQSLKVNENYPVLNLDTDLCWVIVRYGVPSINRINEVHAIQNKITLKPIKIEDYRK